MVAVIQISTFNASEALLADVTLSSTILKRLRESEGCLNAAIGFALEDKKVTYLVVTWKGHEHCENMTKNYQDFQTSLRTLSADPTEPIIPTRHITLDVDPQNTLHAPVTEFAVFRMKKGATQGEMDAIIDGINRHKDIVLGIHLPLLWGPAKEDPEISFLIIGWDSVEDHVRTNQMPEVNPLVVKLFELADMSVKHITWSKV